MISMLQRSPLCTDTVMIQDGPSPLTLPLLDNEILTPFLASSNHSLFAPSSQTQTPERTSSSPFPYKISQSPPLLQESPTQVSFSQWPPLLQESPTQVSFSQSPPLLQESPTQVSFSQSPPLLQESPTQVSFFHWQIQQEGEKLAGMTTEQLTSQDEDGDT